MEIAYLDLFSDINGTNVFFFVKIDYKKSKLFKTMIKDQMNFILLHFG